MHDHTASFFVFSVFSCFSFFRSRHFFFLLHRLSRDVSFSSRLSLSKGTEAVHNKDHGSSYATTVFCRFQNRHRFGGCCC